MSILPMPKKWVPMELHISLFGMPAASMKRSAFWKSSRCASWSPAFFRPVLPWSPAFS
jgi:hypothetical protein